jgi:O-antigen/teichoic acid export membrane protein
VNAEDFSRIPKSADESKSALLLRQEFSRNFKEITRQSAIYFAGTIFTLTAGAVVKVYVARVLGAELLGVYALGMTLVSFVQLFALLGLPGAASRFVAAYNVTGRTEDLRAFLSWSIGLLAGLFSVLAVGMALTGSWISRHIYHTSDLSPYIPLFAALMLFGGLNVYYAQVLAGYKDVTKRTLINNFIGTPVITVLTVILLALHAGLWGYLVAQLCGTVIVFVLLAFTAWTLTPVAARFSLMPLQPLDSDIVSFSGAAFGMNLMEFAVSQVDKILLGFYLGPRQVGIYVLASTLVAFVAIILQSVNQIFAPVIADLHAQGQREVLHKLFQTLTKWTLGLTFPLAVVVIVFAGRLMSVFGADFASGWLVLVIGASGQVVNCGVGSVGYLLLMSGNQKRMVKIQFVMAGVAVVSNLVLIPVLGIVGAALTAATINVFSNLWALYDVRTVLHISPYNRGYVALLIPVLVVVSFITVLHGMTASWPRQWPVILSAILLGYLIFGVTAVAFGLDADDRPVAKAIWSQLSAVLLK